MRSWSSSVWTLVVVNLWELAGVLFFGWDPLLLAFVYWTENVVIGLFHLPRLLLAGCGGSSKKTRGIRIAETCLALPFFALHYGLFTLMHGMALSAMWKQLGAGKQPGAAASLFALLFSGPPAVVWPLWTAIALLFCSHGYSFFRNTVARKEYRDAEVLDMMAAPYGRIFVMQIAVIGGSALLVWLRTPGPFAAFLVLVKIAVDVHAHRREHAAAA